MSQSHPGGSPLGIFSQPLHWAASIIEILLSPRRHPLLQTLLTVLLLLFAGLFSWYTSLRGIYFYDFSIVFDGGWKVFQGQVPYKDFALSHAPVAYYLVAAAFKLFGVSYATFLAIGAALGVVATYASMRIAHYLAPGTDLIAGLITAIWYMPVIGFPQIEHFAFCFNFLCLWLAAKALHSSPSWASFLYASSGFLLFFSFMSKQNAGVFFAPVLLGCLVFAPGQSVSRKVRWFIFFCSGFLVAACVFAVWLFFVCDPILFKHHVLDIPSRFGGGRLANLLTPTRMISGLLTGNGAVPLIRVLVIMANIVLGVVLTRCIVLPSAIRFVNFSRVSTLGCLLVFHYLFCVSMLNQPDCGLPFLGVVAALTLVIFRENLTGLDFKSGAGESFTLPTSSPAVAVPFLVVFALLAFLGAKLAMDRLVNEFPPETTFREPLDIPFFKPMRWADPTFIGHSKIEGPITRQQFQDLFHFLERKDKNFFVFPATTILYGALNKPSPAPWLFFLEGHSFGPEDLPRLDAKAVENFQRENVCTWVKESTSYTGEANDYWKLPKTNAWLLQNFRKTTEFGPYEIWEHQNCR